MTLIPFSFPYPYPSFRCLGKGKPVYLFYIYYSLVSSSRWTVVSKVNGGLEYTVLDHGCPFLFLFISGYLDYVVTCIR